MKYEEFLILKEIGERKGKAYFYPEFEHYIDKYFLCFILTCLMLCLMLFISMIFSNTKAPDINNSTFIIYLIISMIGSIYYFKMLQKTNVNRNKEMMKKYKILKNKYYKFMFKKEKKEKIYIAIENLCNNLINQNIIKNDNFKLSKKKFKKMLIQQLKYDKQLLKQ